MIVVAAAKGFVLHNKTSLLKEHGSSLHLRKKLAESFLVHRGFCQEKSDKSSAYLKPIQDEIETHDIPLGLLINWDQTGLTLVPVRLLDYG